jgi:hypothetical protein
MWFCFSNDANMILQRSFAGVFPLTKQSLRRTDPHHVDTAFVTIQPVPQWTLPLTAASARL